MRALVVDDEADVRALLVRALERDGHSVIAAAGARAAEAALREHGADVIILDLGLPDGGGVALCRKIRAGGSSVPILILTAHSEVARRVEGLDAGADDFMAKPFAVAELRARVRALGRRRTASARGPMVRGAVVVDLAARRARRGASELRLTAREWAILDALAAREGRLVSRAELLLEVWGASTDSAAASLEVLVGRIRRKLGNGWVRTLRGEGYALDLPEP